MSSRQTDSQFGKTSFNKTRKLCWIEILVSHGFVKGEARETRPPWGVMDLVGIEKIVTEGEIVQEEVREG